jgi:hypothetical protein
MSATVTPTGASVITFWNSPEQLSSALRWITIVGIIVTAAFAAAAYFVNDRIVTLQANQIADQGLAIEDQKHTATGQSQTITQQKDQIGHLTAELQSVTERAAELTVKAEDAERGISDIYEFNGARRQRNGGRMGLILGEELAVFQTIQKLNNEHAWRELRDVCEAQIKKTPNWLTPHLYSGVANANLGDLAQAEERLQFVVGNAGSDPSYADASRLLAQIKAAALERGQNSISGSPKP